MIHYIRHTIRNHAKVFATRKHPGRTEQSGEFLFGIVPPEFIMAVIEKVIVQRPEALLLPLRQTTGRWCYQRLKHPRMTRIFMKQPVNRKMPAFYLLQ